MSAAVPPERGPADAAPPAAVRGNSLRAMLSSAMGLRLSMAVLNYGLFWSLSHRLPTEALGGYSLLMNIFLLVQVLPLLGLSTPLIRRAATEREQLAAEMSNALAFGWPVALVIGLAVVALSWWSYPPALRLPFLCVALSLLPTTWTLVAESSLLGMERMVDIARVQFIEVLLRAVLAYAAVAWGHGLEGVFAVLLGLRLLAAAMYLRVPGLPRPRQALVSRHILRRSLDEVPVFLGIALLAALSSRLDVILLSRLKSLHEVAVYAAASRLYDAALMLPTIAALVMMPTLARLFSADLPRFRELLVQALRISLGGGMLIALAVAALAQPVIDLLYRPEVSESAAVLRWLIFGAVMMTADQVLSSTMVAAKAQTEDMKALARTLVVLVVGLLLLTWWRGPVGTAMAVALAQAFRVLLRVRWGARALALPALWREALRQLAAGVTGALALRAALALSLGAWAALAAGWLAWLLCARLVGILPPGWWRDVSRRLARWRRGASASPEES
jgi:O-antigen/teichoic acid export membrane protein